MHIELDVSLDPTLGCGQAHRWRKIDGTWSGVIGNDVITLIQTDDGFDCIGTSNRTRILEYFRHEDDLQQIISEISGVDRYVAMLSESCPGMRILKQDRWECLGTYVLATNANVKRIAQMTEAVCDMFGKDLGTRRAFPSPKEILNGCDNIHLCKLGFRESRFLKLAERVECGDIDIEMLAELEYGECVTELQNIDGVGPKVADCVALFGFGHLEAFPIDARISKCLEDIYGKTGSYRELSAFGRELFGRYAGYAQEFLYHSPHILK